MKRYIFFIVAILFQTILQGQLNCEILKDDSECYKACQLYNQEGMHQQGSYASQQHLSEAIELCPTLSNAYYEKSVAFLKRGKFIQWKELMDKAVELNPEQHLSNRAWAQYAFLRNYEETINDLNRLSEIKGTPFIGVGQNGDYDLRLVLALSYKLTDQRKKAIEIIETAMADKDYYVGLYDHLHLGILYLETNQLANAIESFEKQIEENELAEVYFYLGKTHLALKDKIAAELNAKKALELYEDNRKMYSRYYQFTDQIYKQDIMDLQKIVE